MYIERVPNRNSPPAVLLRESYREGKRVRKRTLANLSKLPDPAIDGLKVLLKGGTAVGELESAFNITRSRPHGHVATALGTLKNLNLHQIISSESSRQRNLVLAMIVARIIDPLSKLATARGLNEQTSLSTLGELLGVAKADEDELYAAMDWLLSRQEKIENTLASRHLKSGTLVLYDVSSTYFEGKTCSLAKRGYSRDGKKGKLQIVFGLLCDARGCPVAVEVFEGNTGDPTTLTPQIEKVRSRFGIENVVWVGDRGMITNARINEDLKKTPGVDWITALRGRSIRRLVEQEAIQLSLFDQQNLAEIESQDYPGERLIACRNPMLAEERARTRKELILATERELDKIVAATKREKRPLVDAGEIGVRVGKVLNRFKVGKHFQIDIGSGQFSYERNLVSIKTEAALDGLYVIRTSVEKQKLDAKETVRAYKSLSQVERAFRSLKTVDLKIRPIYHHLENRVKAHVFLCMLAYYVEWHMRQNLAPLLFDEDPSEHESFKSDNSEEMTINSQQNDAVEKETFPAHSFQTLLADLATICKNRVESCLSVANICFDKTTQPTALQQTALDLLSVRL